MASRVRIGSRAAKAGSAFLLSFATAALVWQSGHRVGLKEKGAVPASSTLPLLRNPFNDPSTDKLSEDDLFRNVKQLTESGRNFKTRAEARKNAEALYELARAAHYQSKGGGQLSLAAYREALRLFRALEDKNAEADVLLDLSDTQSLLGHNGEAEDSLRAALALRESGAGLPSQRADALYRFGDFLQEHGQHKEAHRLLDRALRLQQHLGNEPGMADCLCTMGQMAYEEGSPALSRQLLEEAAHLFEKNARVESCAAVLGQLGDVALKEGDTEEAKALYQEGLEVWKKRRQGFWTGRFLVRLANVALKEEDFTEAKQLAEEGRFLLSTSNGPAAQARAFLVLGKVAQCEGNAQKSSVYLSKAESLYQVTGNASGVAECQKLRTASLHP